MPVDFGALNTSVMRAFREAEAIQYRPAPNQPWFDIQGVFDRFQVEVPDPETGVATSVRRTVLGVQQGDFPPDYKHHPKDRLVVQGVTYDVEDALPDGKGWVYLQLGKVG